MRIGWLCICFFIVSYSTLGNTAIVHADNTSEISTTQLKAMFEKTVALNKRIIITESASYLLDTKGNLWGWGEVDTCGCSLLKPKQLAGMNNLTQYTNNAALFKDGSLVISFHDKSVQIIKSKNIVKIDGKYFLKKDGSVWKWEYRYVSWNKYEKKIEQVKGLKTIVNIAIGDNLALALDSSGRVWAWGDTTIVNSSQHKSNIFTYDWFPVEDHTPIPTIIKNIPKMIDIKVGENYPVLLSSSYDVYAYQIRKGTKFVYDPVKVVEKAIGISTYSSNSWGRTEQYALRADGTVWTWGRESTEAAVRINEISDATYFLAGESHQLMIRKDGNLYGIGYNSYGQLGTGVPLPISNYSNPYQVKGINNVVSLFESDRHVLASTKEGKLYGWGNNENKEILPGEKTEILAPALISSLSNVKRVGAGEGFSIALTRAGGLFAWGLTEYFGLQGNVGEPRLIEGIPVNIKDFSVYGKKITALTSDGDIYQIGGERGREVTQIDIAQVEAVAANWTHSYGIKRDGSVWRWSTSEAGVNKAVKIDGLKDIKQITTGYSNGEYLYARDNKGNIWMWGDNTSRRLDFLAASVITKPVNITGNLRSFTNQGKNNKKAPYIIHMVSGPRLTIAADKSGSLYGLGGMFGALSNSKFKLNINGIFHNNSNYYILQNNDLWVIGGSNAYGQLGIGSKSYYTTPQKTLIDRKLITN